MAGALSTLGLGSQGVLTNDIIDQLREADQTSIIKPIEHKIEASNTKQTTLSEIKKLVSELNTQVVALSEPALYQNKNATLSGSSISVDASSSAKAQNFDINVTSLATRDIQESISSYAYEDALVNEQTLTLNIDGKDYIIDVGITDTIKTLAEKINEQTDGKIEASVLNVGESDFRLILKSAETGANNAFTVSSNISDGNEITFDRLGEKLPPQDAQLEIDGISVTRASNSIDDLVEGVTLTLQEAGKTSVKIEQDNEKLVEEMGLFAEKYNAVIEKLTAVTKYDSENKSAGVFQGTSEIRNITSSLNNLLSRTIASDGKTIADFGLTPERGGTINFNEEDLTEMLKTDAQMVEDFFRGTDGSNGLFNKFEDTLFDLATSSTGAIKSLDKNLENQLKALAEEQTKAQTRLDDRYEIMTKRFAAFDGVIARLSSQSNTLQSMIDAQLAANE